MTAVRRICWDSKSFLENPAYKTLDPVVNATAWPSRYLVRWEPAPVLADAEAARDRR